jgi:T5SS/PEP-CTERM-associated repeat protein
VDGGSVLFLTQGIQVGFAGIGDLSISYGGQVSCGWADIGHLAGSDGAVFVAYAPSTWSIWGTLNVGKSGSGWLVVQYGGLVTCGDATIAQQAGSANSRVDVMHSGSTWEADSIWVGKGDHGILNIETAGYVSANTVLTVGQTPSDGQSGIATVDGPGSLLEAAAAVIGNNGQLHVHNGGTATFFITLTLSGGQIDSTGGTVNLGIVIARGDIDEVHVYPDGTLDGDSGSIVGNLVNEGTVGPLTGIVSVSGNYTQTADGSLIIDIGGTVAGDDYGQLAVSGAAALDGTLTLQFSDGFEPAPTDTFELLTYASRTGTFSDVICPEGYQCDVEFGPDGMTCQAEPLADIPAVSEWGLVAMTLLILTAGTLVYVRGRTAEA